MTEQELYDAMSEYWRMKNPGAPEGDVSFLIISTLETDDTISFGSGLLDPEIPDEIPSPPLDQRMGQQMLLFLKERLQPMIEEARDAAMALSEMCKRLSKERVFQLVKECDNAEEFNAKVAEELGINREEEKPSWKLSFSR